MKWACYADTLTIIELVISMGDPALSHRRGVLALLALLASIQRA